MMKLLTSKSCAFLIVASAVFMSGVLAQEKSRWWRGDVEEALVQAGSNRAQLEKALHDTPSDQRTGMAFLIANMPENDLRSLSAAFLLTNVELAYRARHEVPWGNSIPEDVFLNDVLAYANVNETRDPWRKELFDLCMPLVKDCKHASEAAELLNRSVFTKLKVSYSTQRNKPHQSPRESIQTGKASCTGLSIVLSDACRSVSIPARLVGTPLWADKSGNHTWVEIWDKGWHFTGACEPDPQGLDRGWFVGNASNALKDSPIHAIYAASFRKTSLSFPMVWSRGQKDVSAENVTDRYAQDGKAKENADPSELTPQARIDIEKEALAYFSATPMEQAKWRFDAKFNQLLANHEDAARGAVWSAYRAAPIHASIRQDFAQDVVRYKEHVSPYKVREVGMRPANGWPLVIAMHGGGNAPKKLNDSQWKVMETRYKDHPEITGYKYLALRAPNDTWNGFYDEYVPPLIANLIRQFAILGDVDTDKVYLIGYSRGGYGAFYIGPKTPDRFAAVHASAAAPKDGTISALSLRNTRFTFMIGETDTAYGRRERCEKFNKEIQSLKEANTNEFPVEMEFKAGFAHSNLPDRDKLGEMLLFTRNATPKRLTWEPTDRVLNDHFWLKIAEPGKGQSVDVRIGDNTVQITSRNVKAFTLGLDSRLVGYHKTLRYTLDGETHDVTVRPSFMTLCKSMAERGDPRLAYTFELPLDGRRQAAAYIAPRHYLCYRATTPIAIDGRLDEKAWDVVPWTEDFVDIEGDRRPAPRFRTRAKMLWDDQYFYIAAQLDEPHVWGTLTQHDSVIFQDNDFEVFIDPAGSNHNYAEFEINALNTGWDLLLKKPYRDGGPADNSWEIPGLRTAIHVDGTLNDPRDVDKGWSIEIAIPWEALAKLSKQPAPPRDGDQWRLNFSRVEWRHEIVGGKYRKIPKNHEDNWVWSPQGVVDMHRPEKWGYVQFTAAPPGKGVKRLDIAGPAKHILHQLYYAQRRFHDEHKRYAGNLADLGVEEIAHESSAPAPRIIMTDRGYYAVADVKLNGGGREQWRIRQDSLLERISAD